MNDISLHNIAFQNQRWIAIDVCMDAYFGTNLVLFVNRSRICFLAIYICSSKKGLKLILSTQTYDVALQSTTAACMHLSVGHF